MLSVHGKSSRVFDGDDVRKEITRHLGFTREDIKENNRIIAGLCVRHQFDYDYIFVPIISPFEETRDQARKIIGSHFRLVYIKASLDEVVRRDVKGLYQKALVGEIPNFIGIDPAVPFEEPINPDLVMFTDHEPPSESTRRFWQFIRQTPIL